ncbi:peptidoglycan recognition protein family protein [Companilactobacillus allii]|uniref:Amidase n=1 Tax=Companilactobacillus allii TaxID=1847728 RepID=A0A1P8Q242_9LACO|nr:peptidoglycan recognition family protein [Companilactobacillus allii]APX71928.1 amidase [Companilactobacillus allii]USQ69022.1 peptidoglycan recognition protein family protein [Companilactobacillus allii]
MVSKKKLMASVATTVALTGAGFMTVGQVVPQLVIQQNVKAASAINDYISNNNIQPVSIQNEEGTFSKWFGYENGVGKPEGVVVHETATPGATARNEVTYFNREWSTMYSYVHAFVDNNEIINIHNTDYGVWGAGQTANAKYIQIELCEVSTTDEFARSISNDAYYIASKLIQYNLPFTPGTTVLSHNDVSNKYGDTNHTDPVGYFAAWGYSMDQFYDLIGTYYNNLKASGSVTNGGGSTSTTDPDTDSSTIKVNNTDGYYVPIVSFDSTGVATAVKSRALANNTPWYTDKTKDYEGHTYHRVATNEWVSDQYIVN